MLSKSLFRAGTPAPQPSCMRLSKGMARSLMIDHDLNGTSFVLRNLRNLFKWLEKETPG